MVRDENIVFRRTPSSLIRPWSDRAWWEKQNRDLASQYIGYAHDALSEPWVIIPFQSMYDQSVSGECDHQRLIPMEYYRHLRNRKLDALILGECFEGKGSFMKEIANGVWSICEETSWGMIEHRNHFANHAFDWGVVDREKYPRDHKLLAWDIEHAFLDLHLCSFASYVGWVWYLIKDGLDTLTHELANRLQFEMETRIWKPFNESSVWWMGEGYDRCDLHGPQDWPKLPQCDDIAMNNWTTTCYDGLMTNCRFTARDDETVDRVFKRATRAINQFLNFYQEDGGCDEGASYWSMAGGTLVRVLEHLRECSGGLVDIYNEPIIRNIFNYARFAHIDKDWYYAVGDGSAKQILNPITLYQCGEKVNDEDLMRSAGELFLLKKSSLPKSPEALFTYLKYSKKLEALKQPANHPLTVWLPGTKHLMVRESAQGNRGLFLGAIASHNNVSHSHNDTGSFAIFKNGLPLLIDPGCVTYSIKMWNAERYTQWALNSNYHNLPLINGQAQAEGARCAHYAAIGLAGAPRYATPPEFQYGATDVRFEEKDGKAILKMDIAHAYPECGLLNYARSLTLDREKSEITITDNANFSKDENLIVHRFMAVSLPEISENQLTFTMSDGNRAVLIFKSDAKIISVEPEPLKMEDFKLINTWGDMLVRIHIKIQCGKCINCTFLVK